MKGAHRKDERCGQADGEGGEAAHHCAHHGGGGGDVLLGVACGCGVGADRSAAAADATHRARPAPQEHTAQLRLENQGHMHSCTAATASSAAQPEANRPNGWYADRSCRAPTPSAATSAVPRQLCGLAAAPQGLTCSTRNCSITLPVPTLDELALERRCTAVPPPPPPLPPAATSAAGTATCSSSRNAWLMTACCSTARPPGCARRCVPVERGALPRV